MLDITVPIKCGSKNHSILFFKKIRCQRCECTTGRTIQSRLQVFVVASMQKIDYKFDGECDYIAAKISKQKCCILESSVRRNKDVLYYHIMRFPLTNYLVRAKRAKKMDSK